MDKGDNSGHRYVIADTEKEILDELKTLTEAGFIIVEEPERYETGKSIALVVRPFASTMIDVTNI